MMSQKFLKLTTLLSAFVFLSGIAMEQTRSVKDIYREIEDNQDRYSNRYKLDLSQLMPSIRSNNSVNTVAILEQMTDNIPHYTRTDVHNFLLLVQSHEEALYTNELIGLSPFGTLAKHKNILCHIKAHCIAKLNLPDEAATHDSAEEPEISKKSRTTKKSLETAPVEKQHNQDAINTLSAEMQEKINVIAHARILGDLQQKNVPLDVSPQLLNSAIKKWQTKFFASIEKAIETRNEQALNDLWQANFNNNHAHFKAREEELYKLIIQRLEKDNVNAYSIKWFRERVAKLVHQKETQFTLKSQPKRAESKPTNELNPSPVKAPIKKPNPQINASTQKIRTALNQLKSATTYDAIMTTLKELSDIQIAGTFTSGESINLKNEIEEIVRHVYQNCILGLYGDQKLQLDIFNTCADRLIALSAELRKQLKESDEEIEAYVNNAHKDKQSGLYEIKVICDAEIITPEEDIATWKTIIQGKLSAEIERRNASAIQKIVDANFNASKNPLLAKKHDEIIGNVKTMFDGGKDKANATWMGNNEKIFAPSDKAAEQGVPNGPTGQQPQVNEAPNGMPEPTLYQTCKNHWMLSSFALAAIVAGVYYLWEEYYTENEEADEENDGKEKPVEKEESAKRSA